MSELLTREQVKQHLDALSLVLTYPALDDLHALDDSDATLRDKLEASESLGSGLAASQCEDPIPDEYGHMLCGRVLELERQLYAMTKERDYAQQMITTQESIIENLGRERDRYRALLDGKP